MNRFKKGLALLLGVAAVFSSVKILIADATYGFTYNALSAPEGYTEYIDSEGIFKSGDDDYAVYYRESLEYSQTQFYVYDTYQYNVTEFNVVNAKISEFDAIYEKYSESLDMDSFNRSSPPLNAPDSDVKAVIYDMYDENGRNTKDTDAMTDKRRLIQEMTAEMHRSGCITQATYKGMRAHSAKGHNNNWIVVDLNNGTTGEDTEALTEIVSSFDSVTSVEYSEYYSGYLIRMRIAETADAIKAIKAVYPEAEGDSCAIYQMSNTEVSTSAMNLLTAIQEEESCDINASGSADLDDAVLVLTHYAQAGAGLQTAAETDTVNMDVNGDGAVDLEDAVLVLTVYAETAAGLR